MDQNDNSKPIHRVDIIDVAKIDTSDLIIV